MPKVSKHRSFSREFKLKVIAEGIGLNELSLILMSHRRGSVHPSQEAN